MSPIDLLKAHRAALVQLLTPLDEAAWLHIPQGFNNNLLWQAGHVLVTQQMLSYGLAQRDLHVSRETVMAFRKGSSPKRWASPPDREQILALLTALPERFAEEYEAGHFTAFTPFPTALGITLNTLEDAIHFNNYHEALHFGTIRAYVRLVGG